MRETFANRLSVSFRKAGGVLLLALLAACGYAGASRGGVRAVSLPVQRTVMGGAQAEAEQAQTAAERLRQDRAQELALLSGVLSSEDVDEATRQSALAQQVQIVDRMEAEAQARACLEEMGFEGAQAVTGAQIMTVLLSAAQVGGEADAARIIDAVSSLTGVAPENVKLILTR